MTKEVFSADEREFLMHNALPPLSALRAFEAAARHLSFTKAAAELHVTPGALSHQIRGLETVLGTALFERRVRAIALTQAGKLLYPGLQTGFAQIRDAVVGLAKPPEDRVLVISAPPGFTAKWLVPRLHRFAHAHPDIDARISSTRAYVDFATAGVDVALRNLPGDARPERGLVMEKLIDLDYVPVCSPKFCAPKGVKRAEALKRLPLIHDDTLIARRDVPSWRAWFKAAGIDGVDISRGLRFDSADHALDATCEGAGVLLALDLLAYDDLRSGRLVIPVKRALNSGRAVFFVCRKSRRDHKPLEAFRRWIKDEIAALDWTKLRGKAR
jgi:LysR family transcriptional regulator, glycine cleavage system transcriptional activator